MGAEQKEEPKGISLDDYDKVQLYALEALYSEYGIPGFRKLVDLLSNAISPEEVDKILVDWKSGKLVEKQAPTFLAPEDSF